MILPTIDGSKFVDKKGVMRILNLSEAVIDFSEATFLERLVVDNCSKLFLNFNNHVNIFNKKDVIPVIVSNSSDILIYDLHVVNSSPTVSVLFRSCGGMRRCKIVGGTVGIHVDHTDVYILENKVYKQTSDGIFISGADSITVGGNTIQISGSDANKGKHPDAIQIAGKETNENVQTNISIDNNTIRYGDNVECQGIMHSDGMLVNSQIHSNDVDSYNENCIRVNRANSCVVSDNSVTCGIYLGSQKKVDLESNSNIVEGNITENLYLYNAGDTIVKRNTIRSKYLVFDKFNAVSTGVQSDD